MLRTGIDIVFCQMQLHLLGVQSKAVRIGRYDDVKTSEIDASITALQRQGMATCNLQGGTTNTANLARRHSPDSAGKSIPAMS